MLYIRNSADTWLTWLRRHRRWLLPIAGLVALCVAPVLLAVAVMAVAVVWSVRHWRTHRRGILVAWTLVLLSVYPLACGILYLVQDRLVYYPTRAHPDPPSDLSIVEMTLTTADGQRLGAWHLPHPSPVARVLYCHGNGGHLQDRVATLRLLHDLGCAVLAFDYRGYGDSTGSPDEAGLYLDAEAALNELAKREGCPPQEVICLGESLGGGVAARTAEQFRCRGLVLSSTYACMKDLAIERVPLIPVRWLFRSRYDSVERLAGYAGAILVMHGRHDGLIGLEHPRRLASVHPERTRLVIFDAGHDNLVQRQPVEVRAVWVDFLRSLAR